MPVAMNLCVGLHTAAFHQVVDVHQSQLTSSALSDMVYLEAVLKEAMRLLPAARVGMRQATADMTLSGVNIPKGSYIIWSIDAAHALDPTLWQGPDSIPAGKMTQASLLQVQGFLQSCCVTIAPVLVLIGACQLHNSYTAA